MLKWITSRLIISTKHFYELSKIFFAKFTWQVLTSLLGSGINELVSSILGKRNGKRANCHYICWMAPFMILGYKAGRFLHLPQLKIRIAAEDCVSCGKCAKVCPMSLEVPQLVKAGEIQSAECILCGECINACGKKVLEYKLTNKR